MTYWGREESLDEGNPIYLYRFYGETLGSYYFTTNLLPVTLGGNGYQPWPIKHDAITLSMSPDRKDMKITMGQGSLLDDLFTGYPPSESLHVQVRRAHRDSSPFNLANAPQIWNGRVMGVEYNGSNEIEFTCEPLQTASRRPGLRRNYQLNCPFLLYGSECKADKASATINRTATAQVNNETFTVGSAPANPARYYGGIVEWVNGFGHREAHTIRNVSGSTVRIGGKIRSLPVGTIVSLSYGCNRTMDHCQTLHNNILNYGGQPWIPIENPMDNLTSIFY